jgi:DNA-binding FadR family transcriptional regulator
MSTTFSPMPDRGRLHPRITALLARRVIDAELEGERIAFPNEAELCAQLGVSRTVLRESMKVLVDKGMVEMKPRAGTHSRPRAEWRLLDADILTWQAEASPDAQFLMNLCEVRLAIEPTAAGFAAVRATSEELERIAACLEACERQAVPLDVERRIDLDLDFHTALVEASHNPLLRQLSATIRQPFRLALRCTARFPATLKLGLDGHRAVVEALRRHDPLAARHAAEEVVGLAMLAVDKITRPARTQGRASAARLSDKGRER